ncbi:sigma-54-dependent Fis family transcriptional regulator [Clostridium sediminicola]|uniref:sigma-54-dependent Fis family transcriptional regulator n=1 Tax=Clostridium sediminicola TaxID=3114879 RepID=UPI0031F1F222
MPVQALLYNNEIIYKKWYKFINEGFLEKEGLRAEIYESWKRCKEFGIDPFGEESKDHLTQKELNKKYRDLMPLLKMAKPFMDSLYKFLKDTEFIIRLTDKDGYVLMHIGTENVIQHYVDKGYSDGYNVKEEYIGTNAIGITLRTGNPIQVLGAEHYTRYNHRWTSSAAPIKDDNNRVMAVLSITGCCELVHPHTLGMVVAAAEAIEKEISIEKSNEKLKTINDGFQQITEAINEGIIRVDNNEKIISVNRFARRLLSYKENDLLGKDFKTILSHDNRLELIRGIFKGRSFEEEEIRFRTRTGRKKMCNINVFPIKTIDRRSSGGSVLTFRENKVVHNLVNKIVGANARFTFDDILGESEAIKKAIKLATISADINTTVFLNGESGTGKEMFAQAIHNKSDRRDYPFVFLNCGAIPRELVSSELFGYIEGAFTGAKRGGHPGKFELADGGTIFLDEIGDMPLDTQANLLRVLEERNIVRVGGHDVIPIDVRVIAATNKDLKKEVELGNFRDDLFYRINVMPIHTPALRERREDIKILIDFFLKKFSSSSGKIIAGVDDSFSRAMISYNWPGNVRELQNVMQRVVNVVDDESVLSYKDLPLNLSAGDSSIKNTKGAPLITLDELEKNAIKRTLKEMKGNVAATAKILGIGRSTLYRKMSKFNINEDNFN